MNGIAITAGELGVRRRVAALAQRCPVATCRHGVGDGARGCRGVASLNLFSDRISPCHSMDEMDVMDSMDDQQFGRSHSDCAPMESLDLG